MSTIDTHSHWIPPSFVAAMLRQADRASSFEHSYSNLLRLLRSNDPGLQSLELRVEEMDRGGVDVSVLALPPVDLGGAAVSQAAFAAANDEVLEAASKYEGRFDVAVSLPLPATSQALDELDRVATHPFAKAISLPTPSHGWSIDDARLEPVYKRAAELGLPMLVHPANEPLPDVWHQWRLAQTLAPVVSSSLGVARLLLSGMLDRVPTLDVIVPHLGGTLPYLAQRFDDFGTGEASHGVAHYLRTRLYLDTCSYHPAAFRCAAETAGIDRLVLGSDAPFRGSVGRAVAHIVDVVPSGAERDLVLGGTASRWFGPYRSTTSST